MSYAVAMNKKVRPRRDFQALEQRRKRAARYFEAGKLSLAEIARELKASRQSVSRWYAEWKRGGAAALRGAGRAGRKPRLQPEPWEQLDQALREGARAQGFATDLWTLPRVAKVIERLTGVHYHPGHGWKILKAMRWTLQKPATQARECNPQKVSQWLKETWPRLKKKPADKRPGSSSRTKAASPNDPRSVEPGHPGGKLPS
jgi:transposase